MFYDTFEELCRRERISPSGLTRKLGMSPSAPGKWKNGSMPDILTAKRLAEHFGVTLDYLVYGEDRHMTSAHASGGSAIIQGSQGNTVSVSHQSEAQASGGQDFENALVGIYRALEFPDKLALLQSALDIKAKADAKKDG